MIKDFKELEKCFEVAIINNFKFVYVKIQMLDMESPEIIINPNINIEKKLEYYRKAYNEDLTLKANSGIKIIDFGCCNLLPFIKI